MNWEKYPNTSYRFTDVCAKPKKHYTLSAKIDYPFTDIPRRTGGIHQRQKGNIGKQPVHSIQQPDFRLQSANYRRNLLHLRITEDYRLYQQSTETPCRKRREENVHQHQQKRSYLYRGMYHLSRFKFRNLHQ